MTTAKERLIEQLERVRRLREERHHVPGLAAAMDRLARWQARRLNGTYADLARDPRYGKAIEFFGSDLYGPKDFSRHDADLARVIPVMVRVLPEGAIATVAKAVELSALSLELDRALVEAMGIGSALSMPVYCKAYRRCANRPSREGQIALVVEVGHELDRYVHKPLLRKILSLMRRPARLAGLGALQNFLERGFSSFASMRGADQFLAMIADRETKLMEAIFDGDPGPFPDPLGSKEDSS